MKRKTTLMLAAATAAVIILLGPLLHRPIIGKANNSRQVELSKAVKEIFDARARAIFKDSAEGAVLSRYDTTEKLGQWAHSHEKAKMNFIRLWVKKRGVRFTEARTVIHIPWSELQGNQAELIVHQTLQVSYVYPGSKTVNHFGIGTRHWMKMKSYQGKWLICQDFYTDGLGDDSLAPEPKPAEGRLPQRQPTKRTSPQSTAVGYDREGAVRYADKYAGLAWGAGNKHQYNLQYGDLSGKGGDCTNYVSQCLADKNGGKLPLDGGWFYCIDQDGFSGSQAWVRAQDFCDWVQYCGRGKLVARGTFPELNNPTKNFPSGAVRKLRKGDVIGYGQENLIEHVAIVVGWDSQGYPLVNSHTVDRYHCPWDMGYDKTTVFHLFQISG